MPLSPYENYLAGLWHECGTVGTNGMGITPLEWETIIAWADKFYSQTVVEWVDDPTERLVLGVRGKWVKDPTTYKVPITFTQCALLDYEIGIIRYLSQEYSGEYAQASNPSRPCPKEIEVEKVSKETALAESMRFKEALLNAFGKK